MDKGHASLCVFLESKSIIIFDDVRRLKKNLIIYIMDGLSFNFMSRKYSLHIRPWLIIEPFVEL